MKLESKRNMRMKFSKRINHLPPLDSIKWCQNIRIAVGIFCKLNGYSVIYRFLLFQEPKSVMSLKVHLHY